MSEIKQVNSVDEIVSGNDVSTINSDLFSTNPPNTLPDDSSKTILDLFDEDILSSSNQNQEAVEEAVNQTVDTAVSNRSFLERMRAWWHGIPDEEQSVQKSINNGLCNEELINSTPVLEAPKGVYLNPTDVTRIPQSGGLEAKERDHLTSAELAEVLSLMSDNTLEEVMRLVIKAQLAFEQQSAEVSQQTFEKNKIFVKIHQKLVDEIYAKLQQDMKLGEWLKKAQKGLLVATAITSLVGVLLNPQFSPVMSNIADNIGQIWGQSAQDWFVWGANIAGNPLVTSVVSSCLMGLGTFGSKYNDWQINKDSGEHQKAKHILVNYDRRQEELRENVANLAEEDQQFKEQLMEQIKRFKRIKRIINRS